MISLMFFPVSTWSAHSKCEFPCHSLFLCHLAVESVLILGDFRYLGKNLEYYKHTVLLKMLKNF